MKKIFLFAALASIVFASCKKEAPVAAVQNDGQQEITFSALSKAMTKGVLGGGTSFEPTSATNHRIITVAGTMVKDGGIVDFLSPMKFNRSEGNKWVATPTVYYPLGGEGKDFHFLAYSEVNDATSPAPTSSASRWYSSSEVEIYVDDNSQYNEIVYSGFEGKKDGAATATFAHSQAIVSVNIKLKTVLSSVTQPADLIINKIGFKDVKTSGILLLKYDASKSSAPYATHQWLFNAGCTCKFADMGGKKLSVTSAGTVDTDKEIDFADVQGTAVSPTTSPATYQDALSWPLTTAGFQLDRLFPAQELQATVMVVNYTLAGNTYEVELKLNGTDTATESNTGAAPALEAWKAGKWYLYGITVNLNEITINPNSVAAWETTQVTTYGQYDPSTPTP